MRRGRADTQETGRESAAAPTAPHLEPPLFRGRWLAEKLESAELLLAHILASFLLLMTVIAGSVWLLNAWFYDKKPPGIAVLIALSAAFPLVVYLQIRVIALLTRTINWPVEPRAPAAALSLPGQTGPGGVLFGIWTLASAVGIIFAGHVMASWITDLRNPSGFELAWSFTYRVLIHFGASAAANVYLLFATVRLTRSPLLAYRLWQFRYPVDAVIACVLLLKS